MSVSIGKKQSARMNRRKSAAVPRTARIALCKMRCCAAALSFLMVTLPFQNFHSAGSSAYTPELAAVHSLGLHRWQAEQSWRHCPHAVEILARVFFRVRKKMQPVVAVVHVVGVERLLHPC